MLKRKVYCIFSIPRKSFKTRFAQLSFSGTGLLELHPVELVTLYISCALNRGDSDRE